MNDPHTTRRPHIFKTQNSRAIFVVSLMVFAGACGMAWAMGWRQGLLFMGAITGVFLFALAVAIWITGGTS